MASIVPEVAIWSLPFNFFKGFTRVSSLPEHSFNMIITVHDVCDLWRLEESLEESALFFYPGFQGLTPAVEAYVVMSHFYIYLMGPIRFQPDFYF